MYQLFFICDACRMRSSKPTGCDRVEDRHARDERRPLHRRRPRDAAAEVVADERDPIAPEGARDRLDVLDEARAAVRRDPARFVGLAVAALVGGDGEEPRVGERAHRSAPRRPSRGEAVQQEHHRPVGGSEVLARRRTPPELTTREAKAFEAVIGGG